MSVSGLDLDTRLLSDFIYALNIARRQIISYPPGHPMIAAASGKLLALIPELLEFRTDVTIGIARDVLLVEGRQLDTANPVYRDFASNMFAARIASLTIRRELTDDEIRRFFEMLRHKPETLADAGGLDRLLASSGFRGIHAKGIDFGAFHATEVDAVSAPKLAVTEGESAVLWKAFVSGLVDDTLDPHGVKAVPAGDFNPDVLADLINRQYASRSDRSADSYEQAITDFLKQADRRQMRIEARRESFGRLGQLVERLSPELRRRFLNCTLKEIATHPEDAGELLADWPKTAVIDALEQIDTSRLQVPQTLLDVLGKIAAHRSPGDRQSLVAGRATRTREKTAQLLGMLFQGEESDRFVPADYRDALEVLATADVASELPRAQIDDLLATINGHAVEQQFCSVLLDLVTRGLGPRSIDVVTRNLVELVDYFQETGDFVALTRIYDHLVRHSRHFPGTPDRMALEVFSSPEFVGQILEGLDSWGKDQHPAILALISRVGAPFAAPLIEQLAEEGGMSRRRLLMACLRSIGSPALPVIIERLNDPRWFLVRNLVVLLREINEPSALSALGRLVGHPHAKVQFEVIRTLLHFRDPRAERYILRELDNRDPAVLLNATRLSAGCCSLAIARRLADLLNQRGNSEAEMQLKGTIIQTLAEAGFSEVLDGLAAFIESRSLFASAGLSRLKVDAMTSLSRYQGPRPVEIAERIYRKGSGELARAAGQVCLQLKGALP